jgi:hypothetical protein
VWDLWWTKWFFPEYFGFPLSLSFHRCYITRKNEKKLIILITRLYNKPQSCGARQKKSSEERSDTAFRTRYSVFNCNILVLDNVFTCIISAAFIINFSIVIRILKKYTTFYLKKEAFCSRNVVYYFEYSYDNKKVFVNAADIIQALSIHHLPQVANCRWDSQVKEMVKDAGCSDFAKRANVNLKTLI